MALENKSQDLENFKTKCKAEGEKLIRKTYPQKVLALNALLESDSFLSTRINSIATDLNIPIPEVPEETENNTSPKGKKRKLEGDSVEEVNGSKVIVLPNGVAPANKNLLELINTIKPHIRDCIEHANKIKMWITYSIPRIEDGNNFGVSIQEDAMAEARQVETEAATYLDQISRYFLTRGKIISKVAKYPHVEDYRYTIKELDEKEYVSLKLVICELRNHYCSLHDLITKNMDKIKKPRTSNTDNMY